MTARLPLSIVACILLAALADTPAAAGRSSAGAALVQEGQAPQVLQPGASIRKKVTGEQALEFRVIVEAPGTFVRFVVRLECCAGLDVELRRPDGERLHRVLADFQFWPHALSYVAETPGAYSLVVRKHDLEEDDGAFELRFEERVPATSTHRDRARAEALVEAARPAFDSDSEAVIREGIRSLQPARALYRSAGDLRGETDVLELTADAHMSLGELPAALEDQRARIALLERVGDRWAVAYTLNRMRFYAQTSGEFQTMLDLAQESLDVFRAIGDPDGVVEGLMGVANALGGMSDHVRAAQVFDEADAIERTRPTRSGTSVILAGQRYANARQWEKAIERFETVVEIDRQAGWTVAEYGARGKLAELYARVGNREKALTNLERLLDWIQANPKQETSSTLIQIGTIYAILGERQRALEYLDRGWAPPAGKPAALRDLGALGNAYVDLGEHDKALKCYDETLAYVRSQGGNATREARLPARMAAAERELGRLGNARTHIEESVARFEKLRGTIASPSARADYFSTIQDVYDLYIDLLMRLHTGQPAGGHAAVALNVSERARGRSLIDLMAEARVDIRQGVDPQLLAREKVLQRRIAALANRQGALTPKDRGTPQAAVLAKEIEDGTAELRMLEGRIRSASPRFAALTAPTPLTLEQIQRQVLDADTLLLEYALGETRSYLWVASRESLSTFVLPARATIDDQARRVYELLTARNRRVERETDAAREARLAATQAEFPKAAARLSELILQPAALLLGKKRLLVVTQGTLQYIPFAALPDPGANGGQDGQPPLLAAHEIVYAPSASVMAVLRDETRGRAPAPKALAVLADPVFDKDDARVSGAAPQARAGRGAAAGGTTAADPRAARAQADLTRSFVDAGMTGDGRLPRLSFSRREATAIAATVPAGQAFEAMDFLASKQTATAADLAQYRIVHFATHGVLDSARATFSGLVLSLVDERGRPTDGFLRLNDVFNLRLPADLVVLSACQTALGQDVLGEGLVGLTRGFMYAGAERVAASLWKVDDAATASLMVRFYGDMLGRDMRPVEALRSAQLAMLQDKRWRDPYFWAAFQIQGEWR